MERLLEGLRLFGSALDVRDTFTSLHCGRTEALANELGVQCGLSGAELRTLGLSAHAHDIGKIAVADHVLTKEGRLNPQEWLAMQAHSERGYHLVMEIDDDDTDVVAQAVLHHHEAFDGSGYPAGLSGEAIPPLARMIAIVDAYDAIAERRSYHGARNHAQVIAILNGENAHKYDPYLLVHFNSLIASSKFRAPADVG